MTLMILNLFERPTKCLSKQSGISNKYLNQRVVTFGWMRLCTINNHNQIPCRRHNIQILCIDYLFVYEIKPSENIEIYSK